MKSEHPTGEEMERITQRWRESLQRVAAAESLSDDGRYHEAVFEDAVRVAVAMAFADPFVDWERQYHYDPQFHARVDRAARSVAHLLNPTAALARIERYSTGTVEGHERR